MKSDVTPIPLRSPAMTIGLLAAFLPVSLAAAQPASSGLAPEGVSARPDLRDINLGFPDAGEDTVSELVAKLSDPEFAEREAAASVLAHLGPAAFRVMSHAFRRTDDYETRLRIEEIVRDQFLWHALLKHRGFLGIGYEPQPYPNLGEDVIAIAITVVRPGTAASDAGLRRGDLIVTLDGDGFKGDPTQPDFKDRVERKGAGSKMSLDVIRRDRVLRFDVELRARPIAEYTQPDMLEELNRTMQAYSLWRAKFFALPEDKPVRTPSRVVLELPN